MLLEHLRSNERFRRASSSESFFVARVLAIANRSSRPPKTSGRSAAGQVSRRIIKMSRTSFFQTLKSGRMEVLAIALALGGLVMLFNASEPTRADVTLTGACIGSASITDVPSAGLSCPAALSIGQQKDITIKINNNSTDSTGTINVPAKL